MDGRLEVVVIIESEVGGGDALDAIRAIKGDSVWSGATVVINGARDIGEVSVPSGFRLRRIGERMSQGEIVNDCLLAMRSEDGRDGWLVVLTDRGVMPKGYLSRAKEMIERADWSVVMAIAPILMSGGRQVSPMFYDYMDGAIGTEERMAGDLGMDVKGLCGFGGVLVPYADLMGMVVSVRNALRAGGFPVHYDGEWLHRAVGRTAYAAGMGIFAMPVVLEVGERSERAEEAKTDLAQMRMYYAEEEYFGRRIAKAYSRITKLLLLPLGETESHRNSTYAYHELLSKLEPKDFLRNYRKGLVRLLRREPIRKEILKEIVNTYRNKECLEGACANVKRLYAVRLGAGAALENMPYEEESDE